MPPDRPNIATSRIALGGRRITLTTVQRGPPPQGTVTGKGKEARILLGRRTIAFDGRRFLLAP